MFTFVKLGLHSKFLPVSDHPIKIYIPTFLSIFAIFQ